MTEIWEQLWNAGIPLFLLCIGIAVIWTQWRNDMNEASNQREKNIAALKGVEDKIQGQTDAVAALAKSLSDFFLKHFP